MTGEPGDLRAALIEVRAARQRLADARGRGPITAEEFRSALRSRYPEYPWPEGRLISANSPDDLAWPDNCAAWAYLALDIYQAAFDAAGATFHEAEAAYAAGQASACIQLGF
jgi:hypothetical protein